MTEIEAQPYDDVQLSSDEPAMLVAYHDGDETPNRANCP